MHIVYAHPGSYSVQKFQSHWNFGFGTYNMYAHYFGVRMEMKQKWNANELLKTTVNAFSYHVTGMCYSNCYAIHCKQQGCHFALPRIAFPIHCSKNIIVLIIVVKHRLFAIQLAHMADQFSLSTNKIADQGGEWLQALLTLVPSDNIVKLQYQTHKNSSIRSTQYMYCSDTFLHCASIVSVNKSLYTVRLC